MQTFKVIRFFKIWNLKCSAVLFNYNNIHHFNMCLTGRSWKHDFAFSISTIFTCDFQKFITVTWIVLCKVALLDPVTWKDILNATLSVCKVGGLLFADWEVFGFQLRSVSIKSGPVILRVETFFKEEGHGKCWRNTGAEADIGRHNRH